MESVDASNDDFTPEDSEGHGDQQDENLGDEKYRQDLGAPYLLPESGCMIPSRGADTLISSGLFFVSLIRISIGRRLKRT